METQHTPTPWHTLDGGPHAEHHGIYADNPQYDGDTAHLPGRDIRQNLHIGTVHFSRANAEYVVNACNNYQALVDVVKLSLEACNEALSGEWDRSDAGFSDWRGNLTSALRDAGEL